MVFLNGCSESVRDRLLAKPTFLSRFISLPFEEEVALEAGRIRAKLASAETPIGSYDLQIAAIALVNNLIVVTHNTREFERVGGLQIEDWEIST